MDSEYIKLIIVPIIAAVGGWIGNIITNRPKHEDISMNRINLVITQYEKIIEENNRTIKHLKKKVDELQIERDDIIKTYKQRIYELQLENYKLEREKERMIKKIKGGE